MTFKLISREEFLEHSQTCAQRSFMQTAEMEKLLSKRGFTCHYLGYSDQDQLVLSALLYSLPMTGGLHMEINCGPVTSDPKYLAPFYQALKDYAYKQGALELIVKPYESYQTFDSEGQALSPERKDLIKYLTDLGYEFDGLQTGYPGGEPDWHYVKDLSGLTPEKLLNSFSKKGKPLVKKAKTFGIQLKRLKREELGIFKEITSATSNRREYSDKSLDYYQDFYDSFGSEADFMVASLNFPAYLQHLEESQAKLQEKIRKLEADLEKNPQSEKKQNQLRELTSQNQTFETRKAEAQDFIDKYGDKDQVLAASLFVYTPQEATYLFSGSYPEFNKFYAPALLQEYVMTQALKRGIPFYNFLGIMGVFDGSDGVLRFKQNFNGYIQRKMGTFRYYPKPWKFKILKALKKILGR
ncbi:aminoacyltransferase [Streptococcus oricebi]|uniref:Aminoacyltransferase FemA n=1 Tax=Streptococcus oricebi TaxID=1547447 RepID=A0ABS5B138_9STRE|nr:aminoacyltransferase [Streptococcus oricebi]MBP2622543.1 peptidoglycan branched peptide synthesis protein [Streptococcus oricebi]